MNILFVYERIIIPSFGGVERVTFLLAEEFRKRGHEVKFLSVGPAKWNPELVDYGFEQLYLPSYKEEFPKEFSKFLKNWTPNAIIFQGHHPAVLDVIKYVPAGIKKLAVFHNKPFGSYPYERFVKRITPSGSLPLKGKIYRTLALVAPPLFRIINNKKNSLVFKRMAREADKMVLLSDRFIPRTVKLAPGIEEDKLCAVNNPNTFEIKGGEPEAKGKTILFVGRLSNPQKNVTGFIDVWKKFHDLHPDWQGIILGDGEDREYLERYARKRKVSNLHFLGNRKDVAEFYKKSPILCMTSSYEGWGMVLTEAMAYGCVPVVYDSFEAVHDIITNLKDGILVEPFSVAKMVAALDTIASDSSMREKMAEAGREAIKRFNVGAVADIWEKLIEV